jgi:hypothetical protein
MARRALTRYNRIHRQYRTKRLLDGPGEAAQHAQRAVGRLRAAQALPRGHAQRKTVAAQIRHVRSQAGALTPFSPGRHLNLNTPQTKKR